MVRLPRPGAQEICDALDEIEVDAPDEGDVVVEAEPTVIRTSDVTTTGRTVTLPTQLEALLLVATTQSAHCAPTRSPMSWSATATSSCGCHRVCIGQRDEWETAADAAADRDDVEEAHACLVESWEVGGRGPLAARRVAGDPDRAAPSVVARGGPASPRGTSRRTPSP